MVDGKTAARHERACSYREKLIPMAIGDPFGLFESPRDSERLNDNITRLKFSTQSRLFYRRRRFPYESSAKTFRCAVSVFFRAARGELKRQIRVVRRACE